MQIKLQAKKLLPALILALAICNIGKGQKTYTFTPCGATGSVGPTQLQINNTYSNTNLMGQVTATTNGIQTWTVPYTGVFKIDARGAQGGTSTSTGGLGATMVGDFTLTAGDVLWILVGQQGENGVSSVSPGGGGGGSFVVRTPYTTTTSAILVAGGGTGGGAYTDFPGVTTTAGGTGGGGGGTNGSGGTGGTRGAGGGGFLTDGGQCTGSTAYASPGEAFVNGGRGGAKPNNTTCSSTFGTICAGGFGGGSSHGGNCFLNGGAGGGFSGGGGSSNGSSGGGGSINQGSNQTNTQGNNAGDGKVIITEYCSIQVFASGVNSVNPILCSGNSVTLSTNATSNFSWSTGSTASAIVVSPTVTTVYSLTATSSASCTSSSNITVTVHQSIPSLTVINTATAGGGVCPAKSVTLTASGAATYTWVGAQTVTNGIGFAATVTSGYTVTGANACGTATAATSVSIHPLPTVGATISQPTICSGQTFTPTGTGNATVYVWSNSLVNGGSNLATSSAIYTVTGTSALSCTNTATVALQVVQTPILAPVLSTVAICNNGSQATITASGATNYTWVPVGSFAGSNANSIVVNPTITTTYTLHKSNANCLDTKLITLQVNQLPIVYAVSSNGTVCANSSATVTAGGGISYTWIPTGGNQYTAVVAPAATTIYTVAASDGSCISSNTVEVYTNPNPTISVAASATQICAGESSTITLSGANSYTWSDPNVTGNPAVVTPSLSTMYSITGVNGFTCTSSINQVVIVNPLPVVTAVRSKTLVCAGFPSTLTAGGADSYSWSAGTSAPAAKVTTVYPTVTTVFTVTGKFDATQCKNTKTVEVAVFHPTFVASSNTAICQGGSILLSASAASNYTWMFPGGSQSVMPNVMVSPSAGTEYTVVASNWSPGNYVACLSAKTVSVGIYTNPTITAMAERTLICRTETVNLVGGGGSTYVWNHGPSGATVAVSPLAETKYTVTGTDIYNCVNTATVLVRVSACPGFAENEVGLSGLSVYPNPNNGNFVIESEVELELQLRNQLGQIIATYLLDENTSYRAQVNNLADGIYFVTGNHQGRKITQKIIISD